MIRLKNYKPHEGQVAFHYYMETMYRFMALISGIRAGKTFSGAREALKQSWNNRKKGVFGIIAPTYSMLKRTTWYEFVEASRPLIQSVNESDKIIILKNGNRIHGHSADKADRIRNETFSGFWIDEARECKDFGGLWDICLGRVLSTKGKGFITTSPNSFDDIHDIFVEHKQKDYGVIRFPTYTNSYLDMDAVKDLEGKYDERFAQQEIHGKVVSFEGSAYYAFDRRDNADHLAFQLCKYNSLLPIQLCVDFNVDPMAWILYFFGSKNFCNI